MAGETPGAASSPASESSSGHDPVLVSALSELETEGAFDQEPVDTSAPTPESTPQDVASGQTPAADAAPTTREAASPAQGQPSTVAPSPDDEYAKAPALSYQVDGQARTLDYIKTFPGEGALIREADLPRLHEELANGSRYLHQSQTLARQLHDTERLTAWEVTRSDGSKDILTGAPAMQARLFAAAETLAELNTLKQALADPAQRTALIAGVDEQGHIVLNQEYLEGLATKAELLSMKLQQGIAARFPANGQAPQQPAAPIDVNAMAPSIVAHVAKGLNIAGLTEQDTKQLAAMVPRYVRPATVADRQANPLLKLGEPLVDASFHEQVQYLGNLRAESAKQQTQAVSSATTAAKFNTPMQRARQPQRTAPAPKAAAPAAPTQKVGKAEQWDKVLNDALAEINV